jgi:hypothetical protein
VNSRSPQPFRKPLAFVAALALALGCGALVTAAVQLTSTYRCSEPVRGGVGTTYECFDGTAAQQFLVEALLGLGGVLAGIAAGLTAFYAVNGRHGRAAAGVAAAALIIGGSGILVGAI